MRYIFIDLAWDEYLFWQKNDKQKINKINELLKDISRSPYEGFGKPEALKFKYAGYWSRRIDEEHRLIYKYDHTNDQENKFGFTGFLNSETAGSSQEERRSNVLRHLSGLFGKDAMHPTAYDDKVWNDSFLVHEKIQPMRPHQNNGHPSLQDAYLGGNLFFCGTETSSEFSGYMEGAIRSAKRVAGILN